MTPRKGLQQLYPKLPRKTKGGRESFLSKDGGAPGRDGGRTGAPAAAMNLRGRPGMGYARICSLS